MNDPQQQVMVVTLQAHSGSVTTNGKLYATTQCPLTGKTLYLQKDGSLHFSCIGGWFADTRDLGQALILYHTN